MGNNELYIARVHAQREYSWCCYHEESLFDSYAGAHKFLVEVLEDEDESCIGEIVQFTVNSRTPWDETVTWTFDNRGRRLQTYDPAREHDGCIVIEGEDCGRTICKEPKPESLSGKYKVGDLVFVKASPWNKHGFSIDIIGVIGWAPIGYEEWFADTKDKYGWNNAYTVHFILSGCLDHVHIVERGIEPFEGALPDNLAFLRRLSAHFQGRRPIPDDLLKAISSGDVFIEKVQRLSDDEF